MEFPGGWNDLVLQEPRAIKPIIAVAQIYDNSNYYNGEIVQSTDYFSPTGGSWVDSDFAISAEPQVIAVNAGTFLNENFRAEAMNQQTKMSSVADAPPPMSNLLYLCGNKNGDLKYKIKIVKNIIKMDLEFN